MSKNEVILEIYEEICCDYCNSIIHNHIDCVVCNKNYAKTDIYSEIDPEAGFMLQCECGTIYEMVNNEYPYKWEIKKYGKDKNNLY